MKVDEKAILARIDELAAVGGEAPSAVSGDVAREVYAGTLSVVATLYGPSSFMADAVREANGRVAKYNYGVEHRDGALVSEMRGILRTVRAEVAQGLLSAIRTQARGEILGDFMLLAQHALSEGSKDVAAVLAAAALEDALKRYAELNGLNCDDKEMADVVNALKAASLVQGPQGKVLQSFVTVRNKALHADWGRIEAAEVHALIAFLQTFLSERFS